MVVEPFQMQEIHFKVRGNRRKRGNNEFINRKKNEKDHFRIRKSSTKFHIKIRKTHFKIRKWNFKKVLFKNDKSKKVLEIDVDKDGGISFSIKIFWVNMDSPFNDKNMNNCSITHPKYVLICNRNNY